MRVTRRAYMMGAVAAVLAQPLPKVAVAAQAPAPSSRSTSSGLPLSFVSLAPVPDVSALSLVGDLNGDGIPDVFAVSSNGTGRSLIGRGDGTFTSVNGSVAPAGVLADVNGDGRADLVDAPGGQVRARLARPDGTFPDAPVAYRYKTLLVGDLTGDGRPDAVVCTNGRLRVFLGNGDGTFRATTTDVAADDLVAIADQTGDGLSDVIALRYVRGVGQYEAMVYVGDGAGGLTASDAGWVRISNYVVAAADLNRDGVRDLVVWGRVYLGRRDGSFQDAGPAPLAQAVGDVDGDGIPDLVGRDGYNLVVWRGDGRGGFGVGEVVYTFTDTYLFEARGIHDFNGDGRPDLLAYSEVSGMTVLLGGIPRPALLPPQRAAAATSAMVMAPVPPTRATPAAPTTASQPSPRPAAMADVTPLPLPPRR